MPYTIEELKKLDFWQALQQADEIEYSTKINQLRAKYAISGSGGNIPLRGENNIFLAVESINNDLINPDQEIRIDPSVPRLKLDETLDVVIDRTIKELLP